MKTNNVIILFISIVISMLGFGIALSVLPFFIDDLGGGGTQFGLLISVYGLLQLFFSPVWGKVSDKYGRKNILILGMLGQASSLFFFGLSTEIWMLYVAQVASGILSCAVLPVSMAYISDSSTDDNRSGAMGKVGAAAGLGIILGSGLGGILAGKTYATPFYVAAGFCLLTCFIILFFLPESLEKENRLSSLEKIKILEINSLRHAIFTPVAFGLLIAFALNFGKSSFTGAYAFYVSERFNYGTEEVGTILMVSGLLYAIAQGVLVGPLTKKIGEGKAIKVSLLGSSIGFVIMLLADNYAGMLVTVGFFILFNALLKPTTLSLISKKATMSQGSAMGIAQSFLSLGKVIGPLWAGYIFDVNIYYPYISGAIFFMIVFVISLVQKDKLS